MSSNTTSSQFQSQHIQSHLDLSLPVNAGLLAGIQESDLRKLNHTYENLRHEDLVNLPYLKFLPNAGKPDTIVSGVAEMDFPISAVYKASMFKIADLEFLGYTTGSPIEAEFISHGLQFFSNTLGLRTKTDDQSRTLITNHVMGSISNIIEAFSQPGDEILVPTPSYSAFLSDVRILQRVPLEVEMTEQDGFYEHDLAGFKNKVTEKTKIMLLSNPQNPTGRLFTQQELQDILDFCREHKLILISDDIHCNLIGAESPARKYTPVHNLLTPEDQVISLFSASKAFNVPGLKVALALFSNDSLLKQFKGRIPRHCSFSATVPSMLLIQNLFRFAGPWLKRVNQLIAQNKVLAIDAIQQIDSIKVNVSESTYLLWLDCTALDQNSFREKLKSYKLVLSDGRDFGHSWNGFYRMNIATSLPILQETLKRLAVAANEA